MGDQKYLDEWPDLLFILPHSYPSRRWYSALNYAQYTFAHNEQNHIIVEDVPLIFYHFHQFQLLVNGTFDACRLFIPQNAVSQSLYMKHMKLS